MRIIKNRISLVQWRRPYSTGVQIMMCALLFFKVARININWQRVHVIRASDQMSRVFSLSNLSRTFLRLSVFIILIALIPANSKADESVPNRSSKSSQLALSPAPSIVLMPGEQVRLDILEIASGKPTTEGHIAWKIDAKTGDEVGQAFGTLIADDLASSAIYTAPAQAPPENPIAVTVTVSEQDQPVAETTKITVVTNGNWISFDGDTGFGSKQAAIQLNPAIPSSAGPQQFPSAGGKRALLVSINGNMKDAKNSDVSVELGMGSSLSPGTYNWSARPQYIGASVTLLLEQKGYFSLDNDPSGNPITLSGSTTILPPDPKQPGICSGFYSGTLKWAE
jgi:hypothetical protein